jgi:hypothetical protein
MEIKTKLSTLWIVVMLNMLFADVLTLFISNNLQQILSETTPVPITPQLMGIMAIIIEIPLVMIVLSRVLKHKANRWTNIIAGVLTILFVVGGGSLDPHYLVFASVEVVCLLVIILSSWKWSNPELG